MENQEFVKYFEFQELLQRVDNISKSQREGFKISANLSDGLFNLTTTMTTIVNELSILKARIAVIQNLLKFDQ